MSSSRFFSSHNWRRPSKIFGRRGRHAAFALDAFDQNRRRGRRQRRARGGQIVEGDVPETGDHRFKTLLDFGLAGGGDAGQRAAMKGIFRRQNFETALIVAEFAGQFEKPFIGLAAAVAKENLARPDQADEFFRQKPLRLLVIKIGNVDQFSTARSAPR